MPCIRLSGAVLLAGMWAAAPLSAAAGAPRGGPNRRARPPAAAAPTSAEPVTPAATALARAAAAAAQLQRDPARRRFRHHWLRHLGALAAVGRAHPRSPQAARALWLQGQLWAALHRWSRRGSDLHQAQAAYARLALRHPEAPEAAAALWESAALLRGHAATRPAAAAQLARLLRLYPTSPLTARARQAARRLPPAAPSGADVAPGPAAPSHLVGRQDEGVRAARLLGLRTWSGADYSRLALTLSAATEAHGQDLPGSAEGAAGDGGDGGPAAARFVVDLPQARLGRGVAAEHAVDDALVHRVRLAARGGGGLRVVLDLKRPARARLAVMENPYRVVVEALAAAPAAAAEGLAGGPRRRPRVVLDAGHGGHDTGARGPGGLLEKDVTLAIARATGRLLEAAGVEAVLTRDDDSTLPLEGRAAVANRLQADAFVSIHANAARRRAAGGIETYFLNVTDDRYALRLAAVENKTSEEQVSDVQLVLADLSTKAHSDGSQALARRCQKHLLAQARVLHPGSRDLGVKASLFYVLLGARMPAVLVETSFLSNPHEARLLGSGAYRQRLAHGLAAALLDSLQVPPRLGMP